MRPGSAASTWRGWSPRLLSILRIVTAFVYMAHGTQKLFAFPTGMGPGGVGTVDLDTIFGAAGIIETVGGALLLIGLFTRPVAFLVAGEMAVAYFMFHGPRNFWPLINHGEIVVVYCFLWLYISSAGGGPWSVDAVRGRSAEG